MLKLGKRTSNGSDKTPPRGRAPGLPRFIATELASYALHGVLGPLRARRPSGAPDTDAPMVLFVHGHGGGPGAFLLLERLLRERGFTRFAAFGYRSSGTVTELARALGDYVATLPADAPLHIVGHSLGGVIARLYLQTCGGRARARSFTTLSSPHQGLLAIPGARVLPVIRDLLPGSPVLARLEETAGELDGLPCLSIVSSRDHFVRPWQRASFAGARVVPVGHAGHVGLLFSREVAGLVADHLLATS